MSADYDEIYDLIAKSITSELTEDESVVLNNWKAEGHSNLTTYNELLEIWQHSNRLMLPSGIDLPDSLKTTRRKAGIKDGKIRWMTILRQAAAVLLLSLLFTSGYHWLVKSKIASQDDLMVYQEVKAAFGTQTRVELPDGSLVSLNSGSTLKFPTSFKAATSRLVYLSGEANFKVAKNYGQPFIVDVNKLQVKVLGTTFNVDAYPGNAEISVALVEGKVMLQQNNMGNTTELMNMKPNQVVTFRKSDNFFQLKDESDLSKYTAWMEGKIVFSDDPVNTVIKKLENWYNVEIELSDKKLENYRFTGTFIDEPLEQVLNILNITSRMEYKIIPARKQEDNSYSKRKIILKLKQS